MEPFRICYDIALVKHLVQDVTGHAGVTKGAYAQYVCDVDKWPLALPMLDEAVRNVTHELRRDIVSEGTEIRNVENDLIIVSIDGRKPVRDSVKSDACLSLFNAVVRMVCSLWVRTFDAELSTMYSNDASKMVSQALAFLRVREIRSIYEPQMHDDAVVNNKRCDWPGHQSEEEAMNCPLAK